MTTQVFRYDQEFLLESGESLPEFELAYQTWGQLNADHSNVIWVCHALTANAAVDEWWPQMLGQRFLLDPDRYFIICANMLGSCYGATHALSHNPRTGHPYYHKFPPLNNRDIVSAFDLLRESLGIQQVFSLIGGSLGGQQVIEWAILRPEVFEHIIPLATNAQHSPWGIAFNESQRLAILADSTWQENRPDAGLAGLKAARSIALLSYRNYATYHASQQQPNNESTADFRAASYQRYQGDKLVKRFNAFSYWTLAGAMDSHNVGRGRASIEHALAEIKAKTLIIGVTTDLLFPISEQHLLHEKIKDAQLVEIESRFGHDGFLIETDQISRAIKAFWGGNA